MSEKGLSYAAAGVDIQAGNDLVERIKPLAKRTHRPEVMGSLGGFAALFQLDMQKYQQPVLVSGTDGVGTKLKLALDLNKLDSIGIDLVAMCVNDILVCGAEPAFFLDYYATGKLNVAQAEQVISGISEGCLQGNMALIGGETAEMPGLYRDGDFDLAGFCVGIVERNKIIDGSLVKPGDSLIAIASSGPHSNGYSLIRHIIITSKADIEQKLGDSTIASQLLEPTRIYARTIAALQETIQISAMAHITGGGLIENLPRVLPAHSRAVIDCKAWQMPAIFEWLQQQGQVAAKEMYRTFNCGIGMVLSVPQTQAAECLQQLESLGERAWLIGEIETSVDEAPEVTLSHV